MSNLLAEVKTLLTQRTEHVVAIERIDLQLSELRQALGVRVPINIETRVRRAASPSVDGRPSMRRAILAALEKTEPQTTAMLVKACPGFHEISLAQSAARGVGEGIFVRKLYPSSRAFWYARTAGAFEGFQPPTESDVGPDLDISVPCSDQAGNIADMGLSQSPLVSTVAKNGSGS